MQRKDTDVSESAESEIGAVIMGCLILHNAVRFFYNKTLSVENGPEHMGGPRARAPHWGLFQRDTSHPSRPIIILNSPRKPGRATIAPPS